MRVVLAGLPFEVQPEANLSPAEARALVALAGAARGADLAHPAERMVAPTTDPAAPEAAAGSRPFVLEMDAGPVVAARSGSDDAPTAVGWDRGRVRLEHRRLQAWLDPFGGRGRLARDPGLAWPLEVTLRVALAARLPLDGGLPLHAAGFVVGDRGLACFGPSGAGKSTLAAASPHPVLSDEMVAVVPVPRGATDGPASFALAGTSFWGALGAGAAPPGLFPLAALVALDKGAGTPRVEPLDPRSALRGLMGAVLVPPAAPLWSAALAVIGRLLATVPVLRLAWSPAVPPWAALEACLGQPATIEAIGGGPVRPLAADASRLGRG